MKKNRLGRLRQNAGLHKKDVAEAVRMPENSYNQYENGTRGMNREILLRFADFYDVSVDEILDRPGRNRYIRLTPEDAALLDDYHALSGRDRHLLRTLMQTMAGTVPQNAEIRMAARTPAGIVPLLPEQASSEEDVPDDL